MTLFRKLTWWLQRRRREDQLAEELRFHLEEEADERQARGLTPAEAKLAARRDLGNVTRVHEDTRTLWSWTLLEQFAQDLRYALRTMRRTPAFTALAAVSLALGIGANTAIYSFMDSILLRALPVADPGSLVVLTWRAKPVNFRAPTSEFVLRSIDGHTYPDAGGLSATIFPFAGLETVRDASAPVLSSLFTYFSAGKSTVIVNGDAQQASIEYVSGSYFGGLGVPAASGRLIGASDDRADAPPIAVISMGYCRRRFGGPAEAAGQPILINNVPFTVAGVTPSGFFGVDPGSAPDVFLPLHAGLLLDPDSPGHFNGPNYYWLEAMGRLRSGVSLEQAEAALAPPFAQWVATTARNDRERANLPVLRLDRGAGGLDTLRRQYTKPLYVLMTMVGLILAIACANVANLLLARAAARRREIAVRLSIGAGRFRLVRQLLTESIFLASLGGGLGILVALGGIRVLTRLLADGDDGFTLQPDLNWHVLLVTLTLSVLCGVLFGLVPALQSTRPSVIPALKERSADDPPRRLGQLLPRVRLTQALVVAQIAISLLLLVAAGLFVRTLSNLHAIQLGFNRDAVLLFDLNPKEAGYPEARLVGFYDDLRRRLTEVPGVRAASLSHASIIRAGRGMSLTVEGKADRNLRVMLAGPEFFTTMQIPIIQGRQIDDRDRPGTLPVAIVSELFVKTFFDDGIALGRHVKWSPRNRPPVDFEIVGVAAPIRYGGIKGNPPPVIYLPYSQVAPPFEKMTIAVRSDGNPLAQAATVRQIVHDADNRVPVMNLRTQAVDIDRTINQEIVFARLCSGFAILALVVASVGLYATMAYGVARRTSEIGVRMALGARATGVVWMVLREVVTLVGVGLLISVPIAVWTSRLVASFLFELKPNDPRALAGAAAILVTAALAAGYGPARRASRVDPIVALRHE